VVVFHPVLELIVGRSLELMKDKSLSNNENGWGIEHRLES
jgi:hypothetical protein